MEESWSLITSNAQKQSRHEIVNILNLQLLTVANPILCLSELPGLHSMKIIASVSILLRVKDIDRYLKQKSNFMALRGIYLRQIFKKVW